MFHSSRGGSILLWIRSRWARRDGDSRQKSICNSSTWATEYVDKRIIAMRYEMQGRIAAANFIAACAPTEPRKAETTFVGIRILG